jgi:hypothetical protein
MDSRPLGLRGALFTRCILKEKRKYTMARSIESMIILKI